MSQEIETAVAGALGGFFRFGRRKEHIVPIGTPCANCATPLQGPWCHACGQLGEDFHRSTLKLVGEVFEGLLHLDGRMWNTQPDLFRHPARLTRASLEGHRAPQIPPLRTARARTTRAPPPTTTAGCWRPRPALSKA